MNTKNSRPNPINQLPSTRFFQSLLNKKLALCAAVFALSLGTASAQFPPYPPPFPGSCLDVDWTYDGLSADSGLNPRTIGTSNDDDCINNGATLTVLSGTLTINCSEFRFGNNGSAGSLILGANATLNINNIGQWGGVVGYGSSAGTLIISNNATLNWQIAGTLEQRFAIGRGSSTAVGTVTLYGGALNVTNGTGITDDQRGFNVGAQDGHGTVNLIAGTLTDSMPLPFGLGGQWQTMNTTPTWVDSSTSSSLVISNGSFVMTALDPTTDPTKSTFDVGTNSYVIFYNGTGSLSLTGWTSYDYQTLVDAGRIRIGLPGQPPIATTMSSFTYTIVGGQGVLKVVPFVLPPSIAGQPKSQYVFPGTTVQMIATGISGNTPLGYHWQLNSTNLANNATFSGVDSNLLTIANATTANAGPYRLIVTNLYGSVTSSPAMLTVQSPALVGQWLTGSTNCSDVSGYQPAGTHDGYIVGAGNYMFTNDVPPGKSGQSLFFYNADTGLAISNSSTLDANYVNTFDDAINNSFTISFWAKGYPKDWNPFVGKLGDGVNGNPAAGWQMRQIGWSSGYSWGNYPCFTMRGGSGSGGDDMSPYGNGTSDGAWHQYIGTYNSITGIRTLYRDGNILAQSTGEGLYTMAPSSHLGIGVRDTGNGIYDNFSTFKIYDVRIFNYAFPIGGCAIPAIIFETTTNVYSGQTVQLSVGGGSGSFGWTSNGVTVLGADTNTLTITNVTVSATYTCYFTNQCDESYPIELFFLNVVPVFSGWPVLNGNQIVLTWSSGMLLEATNLAGPWTPVAGATPPYTNDVTASPQMFFKLQ